MRPTLLELRDGIARGDLSAETVVAAHLEMVDRLDPALGSFLHLDREGALAEARACDHRRRLGEALRPLAGVPIGLKDIFLTADQPTTCASRILEGYQPPFDATVVTRLRDAGAIILGKLNMDEFAMGSSNENSAYGRVANPWSLAHAPGGSSGGSAAAVAAELVAGALGTDTGGSIRQPASFCGIVGLKPTYGRVSRFGVIAFASSLDQPGPMARTVRDAALLLDVISGADPRDATCADRPPTEILPSLEQGAALTGVRLGVPTEYFDVGGLEPAVAHATRAAIEQLAALGAEILPISLPHTKHAVATYYLVATAEASSNLGRFDGVRYGHRAEAADLDGLYTRSRGEGFGAEVKRRIMLGTYALSAGYYDAYYRRAGQVRTLISQDFERAFAEVDAIVTPTSPTTAFKLGERVEDPLAMYLADIFTISCNLAGLPGVSLPCGYDGAGLPIGLQLLGPAFGEASLMRVAAAYEDATDWVRRQPTLMGGA